MKRKALNPVVIILNRNFPEVVNNIVVVLVEKTKKDIIMTKVDSVEEVCGIIKDLSETSEVSVYVKQPFTTNFVSGKKIISMGMKLYFPEVAEIEVDDNVDEVQTETIPVVDFVISETELVKEVAPKRCKKTK